MELQGKHRRYLRGQANRLKPVVFIGNAGLTEAVVEAIDEALTSHELIKIKFKAFKEKSAKEAILNMLTAETQSTLAGLVGHTAILYRAHPDPEKRKYHLP